MRAAVPRGAMHARRALAIWGALVAAVALVFIASLTLGSVPIAPLRAIGALLPHADADPLVGEIVRTLRLPRALAGFGCGALLALAGALLQVLLRNPLAEPYVLGVSGGAAGFALLALIAGAAGWLVDAASLAGALLSVLLVLGLAHRALLHDGAGEASPRLLLTGVVVAAGWGALVTLLLAIVPENRLRGILFWLAVLPVAPQLNVLLRGDTAAAALGVPIARLRLRIYLVASLAAAASVTTAGTIGFVGLVVPHALRLAFGNDQRMLLPASMLAGLVPPAAGTIEADSRALAAWRPDALARRRALMTQTRHDAFAASVFETVLGARFPHLSGWGWEREADRAAAHAALARFDLEPLAQRDVRTLSGGERQRVALAAAVCQDAPLLLLDEPLSYLDLPHQIACLEALADWLREGTRSVIFSCHDLTLARRFASHALLLDGRGGACAGPARETLSPARTSDAFGYPLVLIEHDGHEALVPALPPHTRPAR